MNRAGDATRRRRWLGLLALIVLVSGGLVVWRLNTPRRAPGEPASAEAVADFFTSLAALDVEENELAVTTLSKAVQAEPAEPSLWANLTIAHLRLRDLEKAQQTLRKAAELAGEVPEVIVLQAETFEQLGNIDAAIDQLRRVLRMQPYNITAAYSLSSLLGRVRTPEADRERLSLLSDILARAPRNLRARCEQARLAATLEQVETLNQALDDLTRDLSTWPTAARERLEQAREASNVGRFRDAATALTIFENLVKPLPAYQQGVAELGASETAIGTPLRRFLKLKLPTAEAAAANLALKMASDTIPENAARPDLVLALPQVGERRSILMSLSDSMLQVGETAALPFPGSSTDANAASVLIADLNDDFRLDLILVGPDGGRIFLQQQDGSFVVHPTTLADFALPWQSAWALDMEADGDLDLLLSDRTAPLHCLRNNGDMTFTAVNALEGAIAIVDLWAADLDQDGDADVATLDASGGLAVWLNERGGKYVAAEPPTPESAWAIAAGDVDRDGRFDLVFLSESGDIKRATIVADEDWEVETIAKWPQPKSGEVVRGGRILLEIADLDNNGAVDVIGTDRYQSFVWLGGTQGTWTLLADTPRIYVTSILDMNDDGLLDFVGLAAEAGVVAHNQSHADYSWLEVKPRASVGAGDKRINSFGIGGSIEVRAGYLVQAAAVDSPQVHFGLGRHSAADVARIIWPNGTVQAEFDLKLNTQVVAQQRLKGSCPWVFTFNGNEYRFVKDFIWRSPLGLRINAQDTAGVTQTEDWIKIPGDQLVAMDGSYSVRITAELWETHFFDHVRLIAVDHPADVEVFIDERFVATEPQDQTIVVTSPLQPVVHAVDQRGRPCESELRLADGVYVDRFPLGPYQGVAEEHWVEFELPANINADRPIVLVANGWVYPTDSSLNVAIAQGREDSPSGLTLERQEGDGQWRTLRDGLGFPAGKNKDAVIALPEASLQTSQRFRLRTNTETYWDSLGWAYQVAGVEPRLTTLPIAAARLRYRGYSRLVRPTERRRPDIPMYEVEATGQRWRDLAGYYTRYGEVRPLLIAVDDRYVIMNAGDELAMEFLVPGKRPTGWQRDFVLVGDGWVKDGDFNTAFSKWVRPLPAHDVRDYTGPLVPLIQDPVYDRHTKDWEDYHTRYVTPSLYQRGLWPPTPVPQRADRQP